MFKLGEKEIEARDFAIERHGPQLRMNGKEPYANHPVRVGLRVANLGGTPDMVCAGFMHDLIEDTKTTVDEIDHRFGSRTGGLVRELTTPELKFTRRADKIAHEAVRLSRVSRDAKFIKLIDIDDNFDGILELPKVWAKRWVREKFRILPCLSDGNKGLLYTHVMRKAYLMAEKLGISDV